MKLPLPYQHLFRKWLLRPGNRKLGLFISVGGAMFALLTWMMKPSPSADAAFLWSIRIVSSICFLLPVAIKLWVSRIPDKSPDFLGKIATDYFERDGLCFVIAVEESASCARMVLYHQNRFASPCTATVLIKPTPRAFTDLRGLPSFEFKFISQGGEFGKQSLAWSVPFRFQGTSVLWDVAAEVEYPSGRGVLLRGRNGIEVGDRLIGTGEQAVKAATRLVLSATHLPSSPARSARVTLRMPKGVTSDEIPPGDLRAETVWKLGDLDFTISASLKASRDGVEDKLLRL